MNILKILVVLTVFIPSMVFAHTDITSTSSNEASSVEGGEGDVENGDTGVKSSEEQSAVTCTEDVKICPDGSSVGRTGSDCEFTECFSEDTKDVEDKADVEDKTKNELDSGGVDDSAVNENTGSSSETDSIDNVNNKEDVVVDESGNSEKGGGDASSFFNTFFNSSDKEAKMAMDAFLKFDGVDGKKVNVNTDNSSPTSSNGINKQIGQKLKEIVVDGSRVRKEVQDGKVTVRGWDGKKKEMTISPKDVLKGEDFLDFVGATVLSDANIESVSLDLGKTTMKYEQPAKLFGFIPVNLVALVELSGKNKVKIKFPWYTLFTKNNTNKVRKEIDDLNLSWDSSQNKKEDTELQDRARKLQSVSNVMKAARDVTTGNK